MYLVFLKIDNVCKTTPISYLQFHEMQASSQLHIFVYNSAEASSEVAVKRASIFHLSSSNSVHFQHSYI